MSKPQALRMERRSAARSMTALAIGGIVCVIAVAALVLWLNRPGDTTRSGPTTEVDPMSLIG